MARYLVRLAIAAAAAAIAIPIGTASAAGTASTGGGLLGLLAPLVGGNCGADSQPFAQFGDGGSYYFAPNGGFESGSTGWTLTGGAAVVPGNESYFLHGASDASSLLVPDGGTASTGVCYGLLYPDVRFMVADASAQPVTVHVKVVAHSLLGILSIFDGGTFQVSGGWQPSPRLSTLLSAVAAPLGTKSMSLEFDVSGGSAQIDDLFVDPLCRSA